MIKRKKIFSLLLLATLALQIPLSKAQDQELLPPEDAFNLTAWIDGDELVAEYKIAAGYYMYRKGFDFTIETSDAPVHFDQAQIPAGKLKHDEFFGETETYREQVTIRLPILFDTTRASRLEVRATSQGCADIGVCYPPLKQLLTVNLASNAHITPTAWSKQTASADTAGADVAALQALLQEVTSADSQQQSSKSSSSTTATSNSTADGDNALAVLQSLGQDLGLDDEAEILHPDQAFLLSARLDANNIIQTNILLAQDIYLYRDKIKLALVSGDGHAIGPISVPHGKMKDDEFFGPTEVIYEQLNLAIPLISDANASNRIQLSYSYQGCVEDRICYPPITKYLDIDANAGLIQVVDQLDTANKVATGLPGRFVDVGAGAGSAPVSEQDQFTAFLKDKSLLVIIGLFFVAGIGLTFTPCVFPMIPILSSIIAGQGESVTTSRAFVLSLIYVVAMAVTYAVAGAIAGYYGNEFNIQIWFQDPIILSVFAAIFVLLALSMFGFYDLQIPAALQSRLTAISNSQQGGTWIGVGLMGVFSAIIVGPCITAPLVGALFYITQTQDWQLGGLALFALGMGMGMPLLLIGTSAGNILPRAGAWMDAVKSAFGIVLLAIAIWLLERILPSSVTMVLIAALMISTAVYMGALDSLNELASGWRRLSKSLGLLILIYGMAYLIGAAAGSNDLIQPLRGVTASLGGSGQSEQHLAFRQIKGKQGLQQALSDSTRQDRTSMLDFYADWCISCKEMEKYAFTHPQVLAALEQVNTLQADVTDNDSLDTELMSSLGIYGPPAILFFDASGREIRHRRVVGEMSGEQFAAHVIATFQ